MNSGVRSALGPGSRSLRQEYSLHGGADQAAPARPLHATRRKAVVRIIEYVHAWWNSDVEGLKAVAAYALHCVRQRRVLAGKQVQEEAGLLCRIARGHGSASRLRGNAVLCAGMAAVVAAATGATRRSLIPYVGPCCWHGRAGGARGVRVSDN